MPLVLITERFVLLALDPAGGTVTLPRAGTGLATLCAAGLALELVVQRRLHLQQRRLVLEDRLPPAHHLLDRAAKALHDRTDDGIANAVARIEKRLAPLPHAVLEGLVRRDFLHRERDWRFWRRDALHYPLRSWQARNEAQQTLERAALAPDVAGLSLLMLCDLAGVLTQRLDAAHHERAAAALLTLNHVPDGDAERTALAAVRQALLA